MSVFQVHIEANSDNVEQRRQVANVTYLLIPKIVRSLTIISTSDNTHNDDPKMVIKFHRISRVKLITK